MRIVFRCDEQKQSSEGVQQETNWIPCGKKDFHERAATELGGEVEIDRSQDPFFQTRIASDPSGELVQGWSFRPGAPPTENCKPEYG